MGLQPSSSIESVGVATVMESMREDQSLNVVCLVVVTRTLCVAGAEETPSTKHKLQSPIGYNEMTMDVFIAKFTANDHRTQPCL